MTLAWPGSRNSFHSAWLLLLVPPLLSLTQQPLVREPGWLWAPTLRLVLAGLLVAPVIWWRSGEAGGRARRLLKELRLQLPGCLIAVVGPGLIALAPVHDLAGMLLFTHGLGCFLMGAAAWGSEFEQRTVAGLLSHPQSRAGLFAEKMGVLGTLLLIATVNLWWLSPSLSDRGLGREEMGTAVMVALFAATGGPLFSLLSRSTLAGMIFSVAVPPLGYLAVTLLLQTAYQIKLLPASLPLGGVEWLRIGSGLYWVTAFALGWWYFHHLQVRDGGAGGRTATGLHPLSRPIDLLLARWLPPRSLTARLFTKEMRLHVLPWLVAGLMTGLFLLWVTVRLFLPEEDRPTRAIEIQLLTMWAGIMGVLALLGTGATSIAEERELGTLEWQLTQPASLTRQWWIKVGVALGLGGGLGVIYPLLLLVLSFGPADLLTEWNDLSAGGILAALGVSTLILALGLYASSLSRNTMTAMATAVGIAVGALALAGLCGLYLGERLTHSLQEIDRNWVAGRVMEAPAWAPSALFLRHLPISLILLGGLLLLVAFLKLARTNFPRPAVSRRTRFLQLSGLALGFLLFDWAGGAVFSRLMVWQQQANYATYQQAMREELPKNLAAWAPVERVPELYGHFGLTTNATPTALAEAIISAQGVQALEQIVLLLNPRVSPAEFHARYGSKLGYQRGPAQHLEFRARVAARYGLTNGIAPTHPPALPR